MKSLRLFAGLLSVSAVALATAASAQTTSGTAMTSNSGAAMMSSNTMMSDADMYKMRFGFYNADAREVNRLKTFGFTEEQVKNILNLSMRTGLDSDYIVSRIKISGEPLLHLAATHGVNTTYLDDDIPGFNQKVASMPMGSDGMAMTSTTTSASSAMAAKGDIIDVAFSDPQLSTFVAAVRAAGLTDTLKGPGPYTIFAPTNAAFAKLPAGALDDLLKAENRDKLVSILQYHVVPGRVMARDVMAMSNPSMPRTVGGPTLTVKTTSPIMVNDSRVVQTDVPATNGVIHLVDTVLMPAP